MNMEKAINKDSSPDEVFVKASELLERGERRKAYALFLRAAEQGHPHAQHNVALLLELGEGTKKDIPAAVKWYRRSWRNSPQKSTAENLASLYLAIGNRERGRFWSARAQSGSSARQARA